MNSQLIEDIIQWDRANWSKALPFWEKHINGGRSLKCLELGSREGGLSLWLALQGHKVICSDIQSTQEIAEPIHKKYNLNESITYKAIDAVNLNSKNEYDIIAFKSIIGGICRNGHDELKKEIFHQIHESLKSGGKLIFAENLQSTFLHQFSRNHFTTWGKAWNYLHHREVNEVLKPFSKVDYFTIGFFSAFGRTERQRSFLSKVDHALHWIIPKKMRYIIIGIAEK